MRTQDLLCQQLSYVTWSSFSRLACLTLCNSVNCSTPGFLSFIISWSLLKLMSIESMMPSNHLTLCHPLLLLPSIFPNIRVFSSESALPIRWLKYWSFSFSSCSGTKVHRSHMLSSSWKSAPKFTV